MKITERVPSPRRFEVNESFVCGRCGYAMGFAEQSFPRSEMRLPIVIGARSKWPRERKCPLCRAKERYWIRVEIQS